jgi:hypothetical protein
MTRAGFALAAGLLLLPFAPDGVLAADGAGPAHPAMNAAVLARLLSVIGKTGHDADLPASIATALGLPNTGQPWPDRQLAVQSRESGALHVIALGKGEGDDIVLSAKGPAAISIFRVDRQGGLISATNFFPQTGLTMTPPAAASRADFAAECAFWAIHIDDLTAAD